jgi:hypothetical protein
MADDHTPPPTSRDDEAAVRRRRLEAVFGDVLPETTQDEREPEPKSDEDHARDRWLRGEVPPHHG